ncbi:MAG: hypothetical protein ACE5FP_05805 [Gemmatimonadota bacterium]
MFSKRSLTLVLGVLVLAALATPMYAQDADWEEVVSSWPETAMNTAATIAGKYGAPDLVSAGVLMWHQPGPYEWIKVHGTEVEHNFPVPHKDVLDIAVAYRVPVPMYTALAEFDGSAVPMRTRGLLVASCFMEELDILILNLAHDVATSEKTPAEARMAFGMIATGMMSGEEHPYTAALQFEVEPLSSTRDPDEPLSK